MPYRAYPDTSVDQAVHLSEEAVGKPRAQARLIHSSQGPDSDFYVLEVGFGNHHTRYFLPGGPDGVQAILALRERVIMATAHLVPGGPTTEPGPLEPEPFDPLDEVDDENRPICQCARCGTDVPTDIAIQHQVPGDAKGDPLCPGCETALLGRMGLERSPTGKARPKSTPSIYACPDCGVDPMVLDDGDCCTVCAGTLSGTLA